MSELRACSIASRFKRFVNRCVSCCHFSAMLVVIFTVYQIILNFLILLVDATVTKVYYSLHQQRKHQITNKGAAKAALKRILIMTVLIYCNDENEDNYSLWLSPDIDYDDEIDDLTIVDAYEIALFIADDNNCEVEWDFTKPSWAR